MNNKAKAQRKGKAYFTVLEIPNKEIPLMMAALGELRGQPGFQGPTVDSAMSGTNCTVTNADAGQGNMDFNCGDK